MQEYKSIVKEKNFLTPNILELVLEVEGEFSFTPGQFVQFLVAEKIHKAYSITSLPKDLPNLKFLIHLLEGGIGSEFIRAKNIGDEIPFRGPAGVFIWKDKTKDTIFIATGVGLAPYISMLDDGLSEAEKCVLVFGQREPHALFYKEKFQNLEVKNDHFSYLPTLSGTAEGWKGQRGRVTELLPELVASYPEANFFLCGSQEMVTDSRSKLLELGCPMAQIKLEIFT